ncbi:hypothetical protein RMB03_00460 [Acinetobacter sp. V91_7]|uniref:hypothetical protein n=1 Tax=unclassified Acinetobacter TaxID=196816 RepID=UPI00287E32A7|nr:MULTISPECIES: hypothetical protein [unclassified Acinetobacter]MDS7927892.1 hypothetical protein [Acinetobacter sp. V102_4]MDS7932468.1 hypothetical protein [Acinetobacter sp. V91_4B]MDS7961439.1 hypothetical protein [Acinetobacter sp. V91_7]MDS8025942.1 hypothetical protein [Acinetobacter sp. V91_13]
MDIRLKELDKRIDEFKKSGEEIKKLVLGYRTYSALLDEAQFADRITRDKKDPMIRYYNGIKIKMVKEKHYFKIE